MKFFKNVITLKNKITLISFFLICGILLNTYSNFSNDKFTSFFAELTATISVDKTSVCKGEEVTITFEGSGGIAPYTFIYEIDGNLKDAVESDENGIKRISLPSSSVGSFVYKLISVNEKSNTEDPIEVNKEIIIKVNAPPTTDFTFNDNICSGETVQFTDVSSGTGNLTYKWDFGDGNTSTLKNPTHVYEALGCGDSVFTVGLDVTDSNGCSKSTSYVVDVKQKPILQFRDAKTKRNFFSNCDNTSSSNSFEITVEDIANTSCISTFYIDWGDGSNSSNVTFPTNHSYAKIGKFTMKIKGTGVNGCENEVFYKVINDSNPAAGLENPGATKNLCKILPNESELTFGISGFESNSLETTYEIDFGDGTPIKTLTQSQLLNNPDFTEEQLTHKYEKSSCSQPNGEFIVILYVKNACDITTNTTDSIVILGESIVEFDAVTSSCVNTPVFFDNRSIIGDGLDCITNADVTWKFGDHLDDNEVKFFSINTIDDIMHTFTEAGVYNVTLSIDAQCGKIEFTKQICIEPETTPTFSVDNEEGCIPFALKTTNNTEESKLCSTPTYSWTVDYNSDNCGNIEDWEFINGTDETSENPEFIFKNPGKYTLTQTISTGCGEEKSTKVIDVKKPPTATISEIDDTCGSITINPTATIENCTDDTTGFSYNWTFTGGLPANSNTLNPGDIVYSTPGVYEVTLEVTSECGVSNKATQSFEVFESPVITNADLTQEICSGQSTSEIILTSDNVNTMYNWSAVTSSGITGFISSGSSNKIPSQTLINNKNTSGTVTYTVIPEIGTCEGDAVEFIVTVNPAPIISTQPSSSEVCLNGVPTELEVAYQNGTGTATYQWYSNANNNTATGTKIDGETNAKYQPTANTEGIFYYYAKIIFSSGGCSEITSNTASVKVVPQLTINTITAPQTICLGGGVKKLEFSLNGGTGNITYQWFKNNSNTNTGGTIISGAKSDTYKPTIFASAGTFYYYVEVSLDGNGCNSATSDVFQIDVLTDPIIDVQAIDSQELCQGAIADDLIIIVSGGSSSNYTYQWYVNTNNATDGSSLILNATSDTYTPSTDSVGSLYYYVVVSQEASGCGVESEVSVVKVNESPIISKEPVSSEICLDGLATELEVAHTNVTGTVTYKWFSNTTDDITSGTEIAGETNATYNPPTNVIGTTYYYAKVAFSSGGCSEIISNTASVKVVNQLLIDAVANSQTVCIGGTADEFEVTYTGGTGTPSYKWFQSNSNTNTGGTIIAGATSSKYTPNSFSTDGIFYFYAEVSLSGNGCSLANSDVFIVDVLTDPIIDTQAIANQELCQGAIPDDLKVTVSGGATSDKKYQWYKNANNNTTGGALIPGAIANNYSPSTASVGTFYYYVAVSQVESGCSVVSEVSTLIINEAPVISTQPISSEICLDESATELAVVYEKGTGTATYQWFSNTVDEITSGTEIVGETNASYNPPTNVVGVIYYYVKISFSSGGCSQISSKTAKVEVVPQLIIDAVAGPQTVCYGGVPDELEVTFSGGTGNATYQWFYNTTNSNAGGSLIGSEFNSTYTPNSSSTGSFYFYAEVSLSGNGCTSALSDVFQVDVFSDPIIDVQPIAYQVLCQGASPVDLTVTVSGGTSSDKTYQWYEVSSRGTIEVGTNSNVFTPPDTNEVGSFYYYVIVSQPESDCSVTSEPSELIINEAPIVSKQPVSSEICENENATLLEVAYQNGIGFPRYQWFENTTDNITSGTEITGETNATYNPPTNVIGTIYYYAKITFSSGGCLEITSKTASVIINEIPVISDAEITIYSEDTFSFNPNTIVGNTVPNGTKFIWSVPTFNPSGSILGVSAESNPQEQISQTLENTGKSPIIVTYVVTPLTTKCQGISFTLEVTVNPNISSNAVIVHNNCFESNDGSISTNIDGGIPFSTGNPYLISWKGPNGFTATSSNITNLEAGNYILKIEDKGGFSITEELKITQPDVLSITKDIEKNISCFQGNDGEIDVTVDGGTLPYAYNWSTVDGSGIVPNAENQNTLTAGTYALEIVDKNNCIITANFILSEPEGLKIETVSKKDILCFSDATGEIEIKVSGGTKIETSLGIFDYIYNWSGPNGFTSTSKNINNLIAGTYTAAVTDNLGCTSYASIIINQSTEIIINYTKIDVTCYGETNGAIDVNVTGGKEPYQISWSNLSNGFSLSNLSADTYIATITDGNNCVKQVSIIVEQPIFFMDPVVKPISCNGENDGAIDLNLTGGIAPFSVIWSDDASAGIQRNNLSPGTYTVKIVDNDVYQCPIEQTFIFTDPPAMGISTTVIDAIDCDVVNSGSIDLEISGGSKPYSFLWNTNEITEDLENIPPGDYSVEITDANGCSVSRQFNVFRQEPITISLEELTITDCDLKTVSKQNIANVIGGYLPYTYSWSDGVVSGTDDRIMTTMQTGSYILTITDSKGCVKSKSFLVDIPIIGDTDFRYSAFALSTYDLLSIEDPIQFTNLSTGDFTNVKWDFGDGTPTSKEENPIHTYDQIGTFKVILTVEFSAGCSEVFERTINITQGYSLIHPTAFTPNGDGYNETMRPSFVGFIDLKMTIYNTWGTVVYSEEGLNLKGWNGFIGDKPAENGNYIMVVNGVTFYKKDISKSSPVTLLK